MNHTVKLSNLVKVALLLPVLAVTLFASDAHAAVRNPMNDHEASIAPYLPAKCTSNGVRGMVWFGGDNSFDTGAGYAKGFFSTGITVNYDEMSTNVYIHGSANICNEPGWASGTYFFAKDVSSPDLLADNSERLSIIGPNRFFRGRFDTSAAVGSWTNPSPNVTIAGSNYQGYLRATLNLSDVLISDAGGTQDLTVNLYRCPYFLNSTGGLVYNGSCGIEKVRVRVTRLPKPINWTMTGDTDVVYNGVTKYYNGEPESDILVAPNSNVTFRHYIKNNGPDATNASTGIWSDTIVSGGLGVAKGGVNQGNLAINAKRYSHIDTISIGNAPNGSRYCQRVGYQPRANGDGSYANGPNRCVRVNFSYNLTPVVTADPSNIAQAGQDIKFSYLINNNTSFTANPTNWRIRQTVTSPTGVVTSSNIDSDTSTFSGSWQPRPADIVTNTFPPGSTICRYLWINSSTDQPNVPVEAGACVLIAYSPYFTAVGGSVWAGGSTAGPGYTGVGNIAGSEPSTYGSFGEYGVFATGDVTNFGSGGLLGSSGLGMINGSRLTFANVSPQLGSFSTSHRIPARPAPTAPLPPNKSWSGILADGTNKVFYIPGSGNYDIDAANLPLGKHITIYANNRVVRINGNITYATGAGSFSQLPSLTVVARSIEVSASASEIAGYFYATDSFVTCLEGPRSSAQNGHPSMGAVTTTGPCYTPLTVNGAVTIANTGSNGLILNRSSGGDAAGTPAEMFRMRPEVFLTAYEDNKASNSLVITTVHELELSPRY